MYSLLFVVHLPSAASVVDDCAFVTDLAYNISAKMENLYLQAIQLPLGPPSEWSLERSSILFEYVIELDYGNCSLEEYQCALRSHGAPQGSIRWLRLSKPIILMRMKSMSSQIQCKRYYGRAVIQTIMSTRGIATRGGYQVM